MSFFSLVTGILEPPGFQTKKITLTDMRTIKFYSVQLTILHVFKLWGE